MPEKNQYQYDSGDSDQCSKQVSNDRTFSFINGRSMVHNYDRKPIVSNAQWASWYNIYYSVTALLIHRELIKWFSSYHQFPVRDHFSSHKLLSRMAARGIVCQCLHVNIHSYLWITTKRAPGKNVISLQ